MEQFKINTVVAIFFVLTSVSSSDAPQHCTCYTFYGNSSNWKNSRSLCQANGGDLVSIETLEEWKFISKQIQSKTTETGQNQWWIGLVRTSGEWKWLSNLTLTYGNKWEPGLDINRNHYSYAVIDKSKGLFWNVMKSVESGKICENKRKECPQYQIKWCGETNQTNISTVVPSTTTIANKPVTFPSTTEKILKGSPTGTIFSDNKGKDERSVRPEKKPFPILILVILLAIVLLACIGVLIVVWIRKSKRQGTHRISQRRKESEKVLDVPLSVQHMYDQYPHEVEQTQEGPTKSMATTKYHADKLIQEDTETSVPEDLKTPEYAQMSKQEDSKTIGTENGTVIKEVTEVGTEMEDKSKDNPNKLLANQKKPRTCYTDHEEFEDEVFYPEQNEIQQNQAPQDSLDQEDGLNDKTTALYATIDKSKKEPPQHLYAEVDNVKQGDQSKDLTYAEITDFQSNPSEPVKKPTPYYPTEYATVTVHPLSPRPFER